MNQIERITSNIVFNFRNFIESEYVAVKQANPTFPILIRECSNVEPKIYARYGMYFCVFTLISYPCEGIYIYVRTTFVSL